MPGKYHIDPSINVPIYRQLSDAIAADIKNGTRAYGEKLPTVQDLARALSLAKGTVKRCYDQLEQEGYIEKTQGSGTFVKYRSTDKGSRKAAALAAIDEMLEKLEKLNISNSEASIFIDLKMKERHLPDEGIKVAVVASCREILSSLSESVREIEGADVFSYTLAEVLRYTYKIGSDTDIIVTHGEISGKVSELIPDKKKLFCAELTFSFENFAEAVKPGKTAVVCESAEFFETLIGFLSENGFSAIPTRFDFMDVGGLCEFSRVIVPQDHERFCTHETANAIESKRPIKVKAHPDKGSLRYLRERIQKELNEKHR
ncbi:MAG: GntR family transcriptional regulator [Clostridia bacterium]|nr:GntR family transcriptional regulator [Clostridia bacterium]